MKNLNQIYLKNAPLWELDTSWSGFDWASLDDDNNNVISFIRKDKKGNSILCVSNFSNVLLKDYKIGVSQKGTYTEIFSTDDKCFGGHDIKNGKIKTQKGEIHGKPQYISLEIAPFSTIYLYKRANRKQNN